MNRNNHTNGCKTRKRRLLTLKAVSCVPSKRRRILLLECDDSGVSSDDENIVARSLYFFLLRAGGRVASASSSGATPLSVHYMPATISFSATKVEMAHNLKIQRFHFQVDNEIHVANANAATRSMEYRQLVQLLIRGIKANASNTHFCRQAFGVILLWIKMDETVQDEIVQANNLTCLLEYLRRPNGNVTYFVMDMLRYLAGSSDHLRQKMGSQVELILAVLHILKESVFDRYKQQLGLSILSWLVEVETCRAIMIGEGYVEHLFHVMEIYPWDEVVQCNATATLSWLLHSSSSSITFPSSSQEPVVSKLDEPTHCVDVLMNTMTRFLMDAKVFGNTLSVVSGILVKQRGPVGDYDYPRVDLARLTLLGMRLHSMGRPKVQSNGLTLLRILLTHGDDDEEEEDVGGDSVIATVASNLDIIEDCMKQNSEDPFIQAEACGILAYLVSSSSSSSSVSTSTNNTVRDSIEQSGCIETVVQAQMKHRGHVRLQHYALWFHSGLLRDQSSPGADAFGAGLPVLDTLVAGRIVPIAPTDH